MKATEAQRELDDALDHVMNDPMAALRLELDGVEESSLTMAAATGVPASTIRSIKNDQGEDMKVCAYVVLLRYCLEQRLGPKVFKNGGRKR